MKVSLEHKRWIESKLEESRESPKEVLYITEDEAYVSVRGEKKYRLIVRPPNPDDVPVVEYHHKPLLVCAPPLAKSLALDTTTLMIDRDIILIRAVEGS